MTLRPMMMIALALTGLATNAAAQPAPETFEFEGMQLERSHPSIRSTEQYGTPAIVMNRGFLRLVDVEFGDGVIEYDVAFDDRFGFTGVSFRVSDDGQTREYFYLRTHQSGEFDAVQYMPVINGNGAWQIEREDKALAAPGFTHEGWNHVKVVVIGDKADFYVNGASTPTLHVPDLKTNRDIGMLTFQVSGPNAEAMIANIKVRELAPGDAIIGSVEPDRLPDGALDSWSVSSAFAEEALAGVMALPDGFAEALGWQQLATETSGIANLSRVNQLAEGSDAALAGVRIRSDGAQKKRMMFGYSDRVKLFLNGELIFDGAAHWRARDKKFLGTIGLHDAVVLDLADGENELIAAIGETFGGWGWIAGFEDQSGLTFSPIQ